jgi:hypothetical protein
MMMRSFAVNHIHLSSCFVLLLGLLAALGCKDEEPCDEDQVSIGTGCYEPKPEPAGGSPSSSEGGAPNQGAAAAGGALPEGGFPGGIEPPGNPDAVFESDCVSNQDCSELAPICLIPPGPEYCSQIDCLEGEVNEGTCPEGWICFQLNAETRSACLNPNHI